MRVALWPQALSLLRLLLAAEARALALALALLPSLLRPRLPVLRGPRPSGARLPQAPAPAPSAAAPLLVHSLAENLPLSEAALPVPMVAKALPAVLVADLLPLLIALIHPQALDLRLVLTRPFAPLRLAPGPPQFLLLASRSQCPVNTSFWVAQQT